MKENTFQKIYKIVSKIPKGKVATYGQLAKIAGIRNVRVVVFALHANKDTVNVPCCRVVKKDGSLGEGYAFGGIDEQMVKLLDEGVIFENGKVDLEKCLWDGKI